ncbi:glycolate oxidase subunit GlcE [Comamonadaceae bacterium G21597-S1]|nr:glycolate oxidase subunit GlcE [Comamonadaceae bacterium G21597-S1]
MESVLTSLAEQIRSATAAATPLRIRGGGSKDFYGQQLKGALLDAGGLRGVTSYEPSELVVTVRAGTPLAELEQLLQGQSQFLPFEPPHFGAAATVGGMVAAGRSGPARAASGGVRDYVLGVTLMSGQGRLLQFGGQVMKNVAGYDVSRLMAGSMGTLGLITEVSLKVLPRPMAEATLRLEADQADALRRLCTWAARPLPLDASAWMRIDGRGLLHLRLRGAEAAVQAACQTMGGECVDAAQAQTFWQSLREQSAGFFTRLDDACLWRLSVPDTTGVMPLAGDDALLEWGGALRWVHAGAAQAQALRDAAERAGGNATLFRRAADGSAADTPVFHPLAPALLRIHRALKQQFDPAGIFGPGRMFAGL